VADFSTGVMGIFAPVLTGVPLLLSAQGFVMKM
jgi:uncharacterized membrane protein YbaN (DUF454 family)